MGREIRKVPADWQHPKNNAGHYQPMFEEFYLDVLKEWIINHNLWIKGNHPDQKKYPGKTSNCSFYAQWNGNPPDIDFYNLRKWTKEEATCFQVYETVTEGTPISPVFKSLEQVEKWLIQSQGYSIQAAKDLCEAKWAPTLVGYIGADNSLITSKDSSENKDTKRDKLSYEKKPKRKGPKL